MKKILLLLVTVLGCDKVITCDQLIKDPSLLAKYRREVSDAVIKSCRNQCPETKVTLYRKGDLSIIPKSPDRVCNK